MADREIYRKYDADGNLVDEIYLKPGSPEALAAEEARKGGGQVGEWKILDESGHRGIAGADNIFKQISNVVDYYAPKVRVNGEGNGLIITGSTEALNSEVAKQLQKFLDDTFQYSDLRSENINQAIEAINKDLREQITKSATSLYGGDYDKISGYKNGISTMEMVRDAKAIEDAWRSRIASSSGKEKENAEKAFRDYLNSAETMGRINPMNLSGDESREKYGIWGYKKDGEATKLLPQEWIDYYRENYNTQERAKLFANSYLMSKGVGEEGSTLQQLADPYYWTPYLVMSGGEGGDTPVYGFDTWENIQGAIKSFFNEGVMKTIEGGATNALSATQFGLDVGGYAKRDNLNTIASDFNHKNPVSQKEIPWMSEDEFNKKLDSLIGKSAYGLRDEDAAFIAAALSNNYDRDTSSMYALTSEAYSHVFKELPVYKKIIQDGEISDAIKDEASYDSYIKSRDNLSTIEDYDRYIDTVKNNFYGGRKWLQDEVDTSSIYAPVSVGIGNFAGVVIRTLAEAGAISGLTGGAVNLTNIGDDLADSIIKLISKAGSAGATISAGLNSPIGHFLLTLATEIPEDILQTAVDNVLIGEGEENVKAVESFIEGGPEAAVKNIADNTLQNLIFRIVFSTGKGAINLARAMKGARAAADAAQDVVTIDPDQVLRESLDLKNAADGGKFKGFNEDGHAIILDENGNEMVLNNVHANSFKDTGNETLDAAGEAWRKAHGDNANIPRPDETIDENGVGTKTVDINGNNVKIDYEIADRVAAINNDGFTTYNSHSGMASDHGKASDAGGGYLHFSGDLDQAKKDAIKTAAEAAGMGVYEDMNPVYGASLTVRQSNTADGLRLEDVIKMANEETVAKYGLNPDNWVDDALEKGILSDALDYRSSAEKRIYSEHGGYMQPDDTARRESWDTFFEKLGGYENTNPRPENIDITRLENTAPDSSSAAWEPVRIKKNYYNDGMTVQDTAKAVIDDVPSDPTQLNNWHMNGQESIMEAFRQNAIPEFERAYPTPEDQSSFVRNMDYLFHLQKKERLSLDESIGKTYEIDGVEYTVRAEDVEFYKNFIEPQMVELRRASQAALGKEIPTTMGYFPHTDYSPEFMTGDELIEQGVLYKEYSGASAMVDGNFTTSKLSDDLNQRYRVFVNNMLWDAAGDRVAAARMMEEFHADGVEATAEQVNEIVRKKKDNIRALNKSEGGKAVDEAFEVGPEQISQGAQPKSNGETAPEKARPVIDYDKINDKIEKSSGGWANRIHDAYGGAYGQARGEINQPIIKRFNTQAEWLRKMRTADGSLYDNGGRMVVAGDADAGYLAKRIFEENMSYQQVKEMLVEYLTQFNRRTTKGAEWLADRWMNTILEKANHQPLSRKSLASLLQNLVYYEGVSRVNRWVARADLTKFKKTNVKLLDSFLYRQGIVSRHLNNAGVMARLNDAANLLTKARAEALFWGNFKNGILQLSECIRIATEFDLPDTRKTINRLLVDKAFRQQVREWLDLIKPDRYVEGASQSQKSKMVEGAVEAMDGIAKKSSYENGKLIVKKLSDSEMGQMVKSLEKLGMSPVEFGENTKNFILMAGILEEAERKGLAGNDLFNYVNRRFERIGLAANDMGKLMAADNPFFRLFTNLKSFGIREAEMFFNNIIDYNNAGQYGKAATYITKTLGWKIGMLLIMTKLGYGAMSVLGLDPFGLMDDQYTGVNEEDYNALDRIVANPITNALLSGGFTSFIPDLYWASRQAYEDNLTPAEDAERALDENRSPFEFSGLSFDDIISVGLGFIPGYTQGQRVINMTDLMNRGWMISSTGAKKYEAPDNPFDVAAGYLFGPANTPNARAYNQTPDYLQGLIDNGLPGLGQQIERGFGRYLPWTDNGFRQFDPINQNYSDWFNGTKADDQQWRTGYIYFSKRMNDIYNEYTEQLDSTYSDQDKENLQQSYNQQIYDVMTKLKTFSDAYLTKHPEGIDEEKMNNLLNILDTYRNIPGERPDARLERQMDEWESALMRYSQAGLPAITTYRGTEDGTETVYSPQFRAAVQGEFGLPEEAARQIKQLYKDKWKDLGQRYRDRLFATEGSKNKQAIQNEYINIVRQDLDPIVELYGNNIWSNEEVENIIDDVFNSMIPKYGQSVKSYLKGLYQGYHGQIRYAETGNETLRQINLLLDQGKKAQAKALARTLLERVQSSRAYVNRSDLERLQKILND